MKNPNFLKPQIVLITGASGSGKTSLLKAIEAQNRSDWISLHYFDDIGIPNNEEMINKYGSGEKWQESATHNWIVELSKIKMKKFIILEGSFNPEFASKKLQELGITEYKLVCLHVERHIREKRLIEGRQQLELVTQDMENFSLLLKSKTLSLGGKIIDTSHRSILEIAKEMMEILYGKENGFSL